MKPVVIIGTGWISRARKKMMLPKPKRNGALSNGITFISLPTAVNSAMEIIVRNTRVIFEIGCFVSVIVLLNSIVDTVSLNK